MSTIVHTCGNGRKAPRLAAGLRWVVLEQGGRAKSTKVKPEKIRKQAQASGASRYVIQHQEDQDATTMGLYSEPMEPKKAGPIYSLSMLFLGSIVRQTQIEQSLINIALLMEPQGSPSRRVLVFIEAGQITLDLVLEREHALAQLEKHIAISQGLFIFSQHAEIAHTHKAISWEELDRVVDKHASDSLLRAVPQSPFLLVGAVLAALSIVGYIAYDYYVAAPEKKRRIAMNLAKADQTPAYLAATQVELQSIAWERKDLLAFAKELRERSAFTAGWAIEQISCDMQQCTTQWARRGGLLSGLIAALPKETLIGGDTGAASLDRAYTQLAQAKASSSFDPAKLPNAAQSNLALVSAAQMLANASVALTLRESRPWDAIALAGVQEQAVLRKAELEINLQPHLLEQTLAALPANVLIHNFVFKVSGEAISIVLKGNSYAKP